MYSSTLRSHYTTTLRVWKVCFVFCNVETLLCILQRCRLALHSATLKVCFVSLQHCNITIVLCNVATFFFLNFPNPCNEVSRKMSLTMFIMNLCNGPDLILNPSYILDFHWIANGNDWHFYYINAPTPVLMWPFSCNMTATFRSEHPTLSRYIRRQEGTHSAAKYTKNAR